MKNRIVLQNTLLYWLPRILAILFISFITIFSFDVFVPGKSIWEMVTAFFFHLMPNYLLIIVLVFAWKKEKLGGFLFLVVGICFTIFFHTYALFSTFMLISFPVFVIGLLFLLHNMASSSEEELDTR